MNLLEEYLDRHKIKNVPIIRHMQDGSLFLRSKFNDKLDGSQYAILSFYWHANANHPGHYYVETNLPVFDGFKKSTLFLSYSTVTLKWHEYENYWINYINFQDNFDLLNNSESFFACWQMFLFIFHNFYESLRASHKKIFMESINYEYSRARQLRYIENCEKILENFYPKIFHYWKNKFCRHLDNHADWILNISEIVNGN